MKERIQLESLATNLMPKEDLTTSKANTQTSKSKSKAVKSHSDGFLTDIGTYFGITTLTSLESANTEPQGYSDEQPTDIQILTPAETVTVEAFTQTLNTQDYITATDNDVLSDEHETLIIAEPIVEDIPSDELHYNNETESTGNAQTIEHTTFTFGAETNSEDAEEIDETSKDDKLSYFDNIRNKTTNAVQSINKKNLVKGIDTAITKSVKTYADISSKLNNSTSSCKEDISQNFIPIKDVINGMIVTTDNRYVKILEILPINYYNKSPVIANNIVHNFSRLFYSGLISHQFKVVCDKSNPYKLIDFIERQNRNEKNPKVIEQSKDTINLIKKIAENGGLTKRFFVIFEYEGENGKKSNKIDEILSTMYDAQAEIVSAFNSMGNYVIVPNGKEIAGYYSEILYYHFNKRTCRVETVGKRIERISNDLFVYNTLTNEEKEITINDIIAPKGIGLKYKTYAKMDGSYYTYLALSDESYIRYVMAGWLDLFTVQDGFELDVFVKRLPKDLTELYMSQKIKFQRVKVRNLHSKGSDKYAEEKKALSDDEYIQSMLKSGDSLYNVCCIITIRADSLRELEYKKKMLIRDMKKRDITFEESYLNIEDYMIMTMPLLMIDKRIFSRNAHNFTTTLLASLYMFTAYELYDTSGFLLGLNEKNNTLASINQFNTQRYRNANMLILGTSGAGKTFTEMVLGWRMRIAGIMVYYILPVKGYEYKLMCEEIGGQYIKLAPSLPNCINFLEVRPEIEIDKDSIKEDVQFDNTSWLSKTIISAITVISLLLGEDLSTKENSRLTTAMRKMYEDFGITDDNNSIFIDGTRQIKKMPIPSDLLEYIKNDSSLENVADILEEFKSGTLRNFNNQTNVNLSNPFTVFDVDENDIGKRYTPAFLFLAINIVYSICKQNRLKFKAIILDEVWKVLANKSSAEQIQQMIKLVRGYGASAMLATQDIQDFANTTFGSSVISNTQIKFFLKLEEAEIKQIEKYLTLTEDDKTSIMSFERGHGLLIANNDKTNIQIISSQKELEAFTTDTNVLRQIYAKKTST